MPFICMSFNRITPKIYATDFYELLWRGGVRDKGLKWYEQEWDSILTMQKLNVTVTTQIVPYFTFFVAKALEEPTGFEHVSGSCLTEWTRGNFQIIYLIY